MKDDEFWLKLDELIESNPLKIDRPRGSRHPRHEHFVYPFDYGYLEGTVSGDGDGVDVWLGSLPTKKVSAIVCTFDLEERDFEMKILVGCTGEDCRRILEIHNEDQQFGILVERPTGNTNGIGAGV